MTKDLENVADEKANEMNEIKKLAVDHWKYTKGVIDRMDDRCVELAEYLYIQAFMHGHKHAMDDNRKVRCKVCSSDFELGGGGE